MHTLACMYAHIHTPHPPLTIYTHTHTYTPLPVQWIDKIRTPRASNEARQRIFSKLSGQWNPIRSASLCYICHHGNRSCLFCQVSSRGGWDWKLWTQEEMLSSGVFIYC